MENITTFQDIVILDYIVPVSYEQNTGGKTGVIAKC